MIGVEIVSQRRTEEGEGLDVVLLAELCHGFAVKLQRCTHVGQSTVVELKAVSRRWVAVAAHS